MHANISVEKWTWSFSNLNALKLKALKGGTISRRKQARAQNHL